jgi:hypothetical protein
LTDALLAPFVWCEYRPHLYWFFLVDRVYFVILAVTQYVFSDPVSRFAITFIVLMITAGLLIYHRPYIVPWNLMVKLYAVILCALAAVLNLLTSRQVEAAIQPISFVVVVASAGLFVALLSAFLHYALKKKSAPAKPAKRESVFQQVHENPLLRSSVGVWTKASTPRRQSRASVSIKQPVRAITAVPAPEEPVVDPHSRVRAAHRPSRVARRSTFVAVPLSPMAPRRQALLRPG